MNPLERGCTECGSVFWVVSGTAEYVCQRCGVVSRMRLEPELSKNVEFHNQNNYSKHHEVKTPWSPREVLLKETILSILAQVDSLKELSDQILDRVQRDAMDVVVECLERTTEMRNAGRTPYPLPKDPLILATASVIISLEVSKTIKGILPELIIDSAAKLAGVPRRGLKKRIYNLIILLKEWSIVPDAPPLKVQWSETCDRLSNTLGLPFKQRRVINSLFLQGITEVWFSGKDLKYALGATFIHVLVTGCPEGSLNAKDGDLLAEEIANHTHTRKDHLFDLEKDISNRHCR